RARTVGLHRAGTSAGAFLPNSRSALAALDRSAARLHRRFSRRLLDDPARDPPAGRRAMKANREQLRARWLGVLLVISLWSQNAFAHPQRGEAVGFLTGFRHPISGLDHVLAMVAVGLWGAQLGSPAIWLLPVAFPMVMAVGGMLGLMGVPLPGTEYG